MNSSITLNYNDFKRNEIKSFYNNNYYQHKTNENIWLFVYCDEIDNSYDYFFVDPVTLERVIGIGSSYDDFEIGAVTIEIGDFYT